MTLNGINERVALEILETLKKNNCTVGDSREILAFVQQYITNHSTIQFDADEYSKEFSLV